MYASNAAKRFARRESRLLLAAQAWVQLHCTCSRAPAALQCYQILEASELVELLAVWMLAAKWHALLEAMGVRHAASESALLTIWGAIPNVLALSMAFE